MTMRRACKWVGIVVLMLTAAMARAESTSAPVATLRGLAEAGDVQIGASVDENALRDDTEYANILAREFNSLTPENSMKFGALHPAPFRYEFARGDAVVAFAEQHAMQVHGHVLVWHEYLPSWLANGHWSSTQLRRILHEYISRVVGHYRGHVSTWDVVSEAIDDNGALRQTFWSQGIGPEYIALAFQWAHEADPEAVLLYNDYGGEGSGPKAKAIYQLMQQLRAQGVPVHGVGLQMHTSVEAVPDLSAVNKNLQRLNQLGLKVYITEMDVRMKLPATSAKLRAQADIYRGILTACLSASNCNHFTMWGFSDRWSWIPTFFPGNGAALIFDEQMQPKPAYHALMDGLSAFHNNSP